MLPDPIHAAIALHQAAAQAFDAAHARLVAGLPEISGTDDTAAQAAQAEINASMAMIAVAPTTQGGLQAFADYLREPRQRQVNMQIAQVSTVDGYTSTMYGPGGSEKLIARHAAQLG